MDRQGTSACFHPVLSEPSGSWTGRTGLVHRAVIEDHDDLSAVEVYSWKSAYDLGGARRIRQCLPPPPHRLYPDAFVESDLPSANQAVSAA
jgi:hypothetical protein